MVIGVRVHSRSNFCSSFRKVGALNEVGSH